MAARLCGRGYVHSPEGSALVNILLSTNGGNNFEPLLLNTPNDGSATITVPPVPFTERARIKVEAADNIFFDVSNQNFTILPVADLEVVSKLDAPDPVTTNTELTYTITVTNRGPQDASDVVLTDNLPSNLTFNECKATGDGECDGDGNNQSVSFASLPVGARVTVTLKAIARCELATGATIANTATVGSDKVFDPNPANNSASATTMAFNPPPVISHTAVDKPLLFPDGRMKRVTVDYDVMDNCDPAPSCSLTVTIGEELNPAVMRPPGNDAVVLDRHTVLLRAEPDHECPRFYDIAITCRDNLGAAATQKVRVKVPRPRATP